MLDDEFMQGRVIEVSIVPAGDELIRDHTSGETVIDVGDVADFAEDGGSLIIDGNVYTYTSSDDDLAQITISPGLLDNYEESTEVLIYPLSEEKMAMVELLDNDEAITARIPHSLQNMFEDEIRDANDQESVWVAMEDGDYVLYDAIGQVPRVDGNTIYNLPPAPPDTPTSAPPSSPNITLVGGITQLFAKWDAVIHTWDVVYEVHVSTTSGFTADPTTLYDTTKATQMTIAKMPDGTPLTHGDEGSPTVYYARIVARTENDLKAAAGGESSAALRRAANEEISSLFAYFGDVTFDQMIGGTISVTALLSGAIKTAQSGKRVEISPDGITLFDAAENPVVELPTDLNKTASFSGNLVANFLSIAGSGSVLSGAEFDVKSGGNIVLRGVSSSPSQPPTISLAYPILTYTGYTELSPTSTGAQGIEDVWCDGTNVFAIARELNFTTNNYHWKIVQAPKNGGATTDRTAEVTASGGARVPFAITKIGSFWYTLDQPGNSGAAYDVYLTKRNDDATLSIVETRLIDASWQWIGISTEGTNLWVLAHHLGVWKVRRFDQGAGLGLIETLTSGYGTGSISKGSFVVGNFDFGGLRFLVGDNDTKTIRSFYQNGSILTYLQSESFPVKNAQSPFPLYRDGDTSTSIRELATGGVDMINGGTWSCREYSGTWWSGAESDKWWASYAFKDTNISGGTAESVQSPKVTMTAKKRAGIQIYAPPLAPVGSNDPNAYAFFVGRGSTEPARTAMWRQTPDPADLAETMVIKVVSFTGANPLATGTFTGSSPGAFESETLNADGVPMTQLLGDGTARIDGLIRPGFGVTMYGPGTVPVGWLECQGQAVSRTTYAALFAAIGTTWGNGDGSTTFNLPDGKSRFPIGAGQLKSLGQTDGRADDGTLAGRNPLHNHSISNTVMADSQNTSTGGSAGRLQGVAGNITHNHGGNTGTNAEGSIPHFTVRNLIKY